MKKRFNLFILLSTVLLLWIASYYLADPFWRTKVNSDDAHHYLLFYEKIMNEEDFDDLLLQFVTEDEYDGSLSDAAELIEMRGKCEFLPYLERRCREFKAMPSDTLTRNSLSREFLWLTWGRHHSVGMLNDRCCLKRLYDSVDKLKAACKAKDEKDSH